MFRWRKSKLERAEENSIPFKIELGGFRHIPVPTGAVPWVGNSLFNGMDGAAPPRGGGYCISIEFELTQ
jgi:hypothetical protein